jgi:hypothetical protein
MLKEESMRACVQRAFSLETFAPPARPPGERIGVQSLLLNWSLRRGHGGFRRSTGGRPVFADLMIQHDRCCVIPMCP